MINGHLRAAMRTAGVARGATCGSQNGFPRCAEPLPARFAGSTSAERGEDRHWHCFIPIQYNVDTEFRGCEGRTGHGPQGKRGLGGGGHGGRPACTVAGGKGDRSAHAAACAVAAVVGVGRHAVPRWLRGYREGGLDAVRCRRRCGPGKPSHLTPEQARQVVAEAAKGMFATAQAVRDWIEQRFRVVYTRDSMYTLLPRLGIRRKMPRPRHAKTDPQAQATWQKGGSGNAGPWRTGCIRPWRPSRRSWNRS